MEGDPLGEREQEVAAGAGLHRGGRASPQPRLLALERVEPILPDLAISGGRRGVDSQGAVGGRDKELAGVGGDGLDATGHAGYQLNGVIRAVHHGQPRSGWPSPLRDVAAVVVVWEEDAQVVQIGKARP